jgi:nucleotide-binding universal stress UspA family protein
MYKNILLPTDGSERSRMALREGVDLAKALGAQVTAITVTPPFHPSQTLGFYANMLTATSEEYQTYMAKIAKQRLDEAKKIAAIAEVICDVVHAEHEHPYQAIIEAAKSKGCDAILMASHGHGGMSSLLLGSETLKVLTHSIVPTIVYHQPRTSIAQRLAAS